MRLRGNGSSARRELGVIHHLLPQPAVALFFDQRDGRGRIDGGHVDDAGQQVLRNLRHGFVRHMAPGLFSTTTGTPNSLLMNSAMGRPNKSAPPPGPLGKTSRMARVGQACARDALTRPISGHAAAACSRRRRVAKGSSSARWFKWMGRMQGPLSGSMRSTLVADSGRAKGRNLRRSNRRCEFGAGLLPGHCAAAGAGGGLNTPEPKLTLKSEHQIDTAVNSSSV